MFSRLNRFSDIFQFGWSEGYCSTFHTTQYLGLECPAVALSLTSILSSRVWFLRVTMLPSGDLLNFGLKETIVALTTFGKQFAFGLD